MIDISEFPKHLESIRLNDWQKLFDLNDRIIKLKSFGEFNDMESTDENVIAMPYWNWSEITAEFIKIADDLNLLPMFDWTSWIEGNEILYNSELDFDSLDEITLCKLLTLIVHTDRFNDGFLIFQFGNGTISKIVSSIKHHVYRLKQIQKNLQCTYCGITEDEIKLLYEHSLKTLKQPLTKSPRGNLIEIDLSQSSRPDDSGEKNIYNCYWCNNAKSDTFTYEEFLEIGKVIGRIWRKRLG